MPRRTCLAYVRAVKLTRFARVHRDDLLLGAAVLLVVAGAIAADLGDGRRPDAFAYLFAVGLAALMLVRRTLPVLALVGTVVGLLGYYSADYPAIGLAVPMAGALYSAAEAGKARWAIGTAAVALAGSTFIRIEMGQSIGYLIGYEFAWTVGLMAAAIALGDGVRSRRNWRSETQRNADREAAHQVQVERLRIARDLHDSLAHTASVISLHTHVAAEALADDTRAARAALGNVRAATDEAMRQLRTTVGLLRAPADAPDSPDSLARIDALIGLTGASGLAVDLEVIGDPVELPVDVDTAAFRIVQESLTNVLRHSGARQVEIAISYLPSELGIRIADDGRGPAGAGSGHGLVGMAERAQLVGGTCTAGARRGGGFTVEAALPMGDA